MATVTPIDRNYILELWRDLAGNPANRCLVLARVVANHGSNELKQLVAALIKSDTLPRDGRAQALKLLQVDSLLPTLRPLIEQGISKPQPIRIDPELGRLAIALKLTAPFRLWCIGRELTRREQGSGHVNRDALRAAVTKYDYKISNDHFSRIIRDGIGVFWDIDRNQEKIYVRSPRRLAPLLTEMAFKETPALIVTNPPGVRDIYTCASGSHEAFEASLYAGWMTHREAPTISKKVLVMLFGRGEDTLRRWERNQLQDSLTVRTNYAQYHVPHNEWATVIPDHVQPYLANVIKEGRHTQVTAYRWRISNTYIPHGIKQHPYLGQASKVRRNVQEVIERFSCGSPALEQSSQPAYLQKPLKLYFENPKRLKRYVQKVGCDERYLWRGLDRNGVGVFEATMSYGQTSSMERAPSKDEYRQFKKQEQARIKYLEAHVA
jgi:hypothetical protein